MGSPYFESHQMCRLVLTIFLSSGTETHYHLWWPFLPKASLNLCFVLESLNLRFQIQQFLEIMELLLNDSLSSLSKFWIFHQIANFYAHL